MVVICEHLATKLLGLFKGLQLSIQSGEISCYSYVKDFDMDSQRGS